MQKPDGGARVWDGNLAYGAEVIYSCGPNAMFKTDEGLKETIVSHCQWSKLWSQDYLPPCESALEFI